jgi:hypothetical protein
MQQQRRATTSQSPALAGNSGGSRLKLSGPTEIIPPQEQPTAERRCLRSQYQWSGLYTILSQNTRAVPAGRLAVEAVLPCCDAAMSDYVAVHGGLRREAFHRSRRRQRHDKRPRFSRRARRRCGGRLFRRKNGSVPVVPPATLGKNKIRLESACQRWCRRIRIGISGVQCAFRVSAFAQILRRAGI